MSASQTTTTVANPGTLPATLGEITATTIGLLPQLVQSGEAVAADVANHASATQTLGDSIAGINTASQAILPALGHQDQQNVSAGLTLLDELFNFFKSFHI